MANSSDDPEHRSLCQAPSEIYRRLAQPPLHNVRIFAAAKSLERLREQTLQLFDADVSEGLNRPIGMAEQFKWIALSPLRPLSCPHAAPPRFRKEHLQKRRTALARHREAELPSERHPAPACH